VWDDAVFCGSDGCVRCQPEEDEQCEHLCSSVEACEICNDTRGGA
jgi:hypothetical protein